MRRLNKMKINVNFNGQLRQISGKECEELEIADDAGIDSLVSNLAKSYGSEFKKILVDESGRVRASVIVLVNDVPVEKGAPPPLKDGDAVSLLPAIAGG
jgi:MoaD family protein